MLLSIFLPILIVVGMNLVDTIKDKTYWENQSLVYGIPTTWIGLFFLTLPLLVGIGIFWSGRWRFPIFVAGTVCLAFFLFVTIFRIEPHTPPDKRIIHWYANTNIPAGTDVYCNGVCLGPIPLKIPVKELVTKVPEWTSPPEQCFYEEETVQNYTWFPWDDFRKERFLETKELLNFKTSSGTLSPADRKKQSAKYDADCRYWWRLENNKCQLIGRKRSYTSSHLSYRSYEQVNDYDVTMDDVFSPSAAFHAWLLVHVLEELTESEKNEWDKHVLKHWSLLSTTLNYTLKNYTLVIESPKYRSENTNDMRVKKIETALDSVARLKYGLSDPPTEEECRQLLTNWVNQSIENQQPFVISHSYNSYSRRRDFFSYSQASITNYETPLIDTAIKLMGETIRKPLAEQWRTNYYRSENGWAPLLYVSGQDCSKEYFNDMVCYFATTYNGESELLSNQNEHVIPLFRTMMYRKNFLDFVKPDAKRYEQSMTDSIIFYGHVDNPLLEATFCEYIVHVLSDSKFQKIDREILNNIVVRIISERIWRMNKDELTVWINSLPLEQTSKDLLFRKSMIMFKRADKTTIGFATLQGASGLEIEIEMKKNLEKVNRWFAENPDGTLHQFSRTFADDFELRNKLNTQKNYKAYYTTPTKNPTHVIPLEGNFVENISPTEDRLPQDLVTTLLQRNTPETQKTIKQLCNNEVDRGIVLAAIISKYSPVRLDYRTFFSSEYLFYASINYPDYILDIFETLNEEERAELIPGLALCPSPRVEQILEKWSQTDDEMLKQKITHSLKIRQQRKMIREQSKKLFHELIEEKIQPDDLLVPQTLWVWKDGKYEQKISR
jgi:hypothetical protein